MPEPIADSESLFSFLSPDDLSSKGRLKWKRFEPAFDSETNRLATSVCREHGRHDLRQCGETWAARRGRPLAGWASMPASRPRSMELSVEETAGDYPGHCDMFDWPDAQEAIQELCSELALWVRIELLPARERIDR